MKMRNVLPKLVEAQKNHAPPPVHLHLPFDPVAEGLELSAAQEWKVAVQLMGTRATFSEAFAKLVSLAHGGDAEAQFYAHTIMTGLPSLSTTDAGQELIALPVTKSPFKHGLKKHPAYMLLTRGGERLAQKAKAGNGAAALILALYPSHSDLITGKKKSHRSTARALYYFNLALKDERLIAKITPYHKELFDRNLNCMIDDATLSPDSDKNKTVHFPDGSHAPVTLLCKIFKKVRGLQIAHPATPI